RQYNKANDYYFKAKKTADAQLNPCDRSPFTYSMAMVLYRQQNFAQSAGYFKEAFTSQATCPVQTTAIALQQQEIQSNIGLCQIQLRQYDQALLHFDTALQIANRFKDSLGAITMDKIYGVVYGNMAKVYAATNRLDLAESYSRKSIALNGRYGYEQRDAQAVQLQLATILGRQGNYTAMRQQLQASRASLDTLPDAKLEADWRQLISTFYGQTGQPIKELHYLKSHLSLRDSLQAEQNSLVQADINRQLTEKEKELQILALQKDNELVYLYFGVAFALAVMAGFIVYLVYKNGQRNRKNLVLQKALNQRISEQKSALAAETAQRQRVITEAVIKAQEAERSSIGLELHDNVNQILTTVKLHNEMVLDGIGDSQILLHKSSRYLQECINEIRSLSKRLSAPTLGKITLEESVRDLVESVNSTNKIKITLDVNGLRSPGISQEIHLALYRIMQEQLNNILKHAEATYVQVVLAQTSTTLTLSISDDGKGFDAQKKTAGIGIVNMRTRAENLNGRFQLAGTPGTGSQLTVEIPFSTAGAEV
ncbi:MAG: Signal transduction histidine kinase, partial [Flaviaesturariibacter sp.]|nr:Signal transduction histidine kinase [Flaviaesturariibacter sp.]